MSERPDPNPRRGRGRPRSFDPDTALDAAVALFWTKGYDATSLDDLGAAMGLARPSIYRAFGPKDQLFLKALERYRDTVASVPLDALEGSGGARAGLAAFLEGTIAYTNADAAHPGCLIGSIATAVDDRAIRAAATAAVDRVRAVAAARLARAVAEGELAAGFDAEAGARRTVDAMLSLTAHARLGTPVAELRASIPDRVALILGAG
jgi:TetR/AcrR family transcriptional regulator, copper-responsive repressor